MDASAYFKGKKVTLMGLGLLGRGVGDAKFLASCGADLTITDLKSEAELASSLEELKQFTNIKFTLGAHKLEDFQNRDLIIKAAGVPLDSPYIAEAKKNGIPVRMSADLFMELADIWAVGVTGTRGKSTVTQAVYEMISRIRGKERVHLGGNVRGVSTLALLPKVRPGKNPEGDIAVLELDSWQCQGLGEAKLSPHIAVFTNFMPDHLNYYQGDLGTYFNDKANIYKYQTSEDSLVVIDEPLAAKLSADSSIASHVISALKNIPSDWHFDEWKLKIPGAHNKQNIAGAAIAVRELLGHTPGISRMIREIAEEFKGVPGRLELVREIDGIKIYNDTNSTTPEATTAALEALDPNANRNIILIVGGFDKGLDMRALFKKIPEHCKKIVLLKMSGPNAEAIDHEFHYHLNSTDSFDSLEPAVQEAMKTALAGDIVLFSPAFASFGMFKNEYDRGDQFNALVTAL